MIIFYSLIEYDGNCKLTYIIYIEHSDDNNGLNETW